MRSWMVLALGCVIVVAGGELRPLAGGEVAVVVAEGAGPAERLAQTELTDTLGRMYPQDRFMPDGSDGGGDRIILVGTPETLATVSGLQVAESPEPGGFIVRRTEFHGKPAGVIVGADGAAALAGTYRLLEHLGCGFYLSFESVPVRDEAFSFDRWELRDHPAVGVRIVFNWHNFLSGCSTWNVAHWLAWVSNANRMGYNAVMVHAYGNNPMAGYSFRGRTRPVGYLTSTRVGRDWSTNHVDDVRRLCGGALFDQEVFGGTAAVLGTDDERIAAARGLMQPVFAEAQRRGMDVYFALDVDTESANPQELVKMLDADERFRVGDFWLPRPDSDGGYEMVLAQTRDLLQAYPQIDHLVVWFRRNATMSLWRTLKLSDLPDPWQQEYRAQTARTPEAEQYWHGPGLFAIGKIAAAYQRALHEIGRDDVRIAAGSWTFDFLPAAHRYFPPEVAFLPLDYEVLRGKSQLATTQGRAAIAAVAVDRDVVPITWAHHDDGHYLGRPYTPYADFCSKLEESRAAGYGVIHWMTRPLDLYFKSLVRQCWQNSRNEPLARTCEVMARDCVGEAGAREFAAYLQDWIVTMPTIGRETSDFFVDHALEDIEAAGEGYERRMARLEALAKVDLAEPGQAWLEYFSGLERFILGVYQAENLLQEARQAYEAGEMTRAAELIGSCRPEEVIEDFARFSQAGFVTRGEQGMVVSLNTRWLSHYDRFRQQLALLPVRYDFGPTLHDPLAQSPGKFTYHYGSDGTRWFVQGTAETGALTFELPQECIVGMAAELTDTQAALCRTGIIFTEPLILRLQPIMARDSRAKRYEPVPLPQGRYRLKLLLLEPEILPGDRVFDLDIMARNSSEAHDQVGAASLKRVRVDLGRAALAPRTAAVVPMEIELKEPGAVDLLLSPLQGAAVLCAAVLEPYADN